MDEEIFYWIYFSYGLASDRLIILTINLLKISQVIEKSHGKPKKISILVQRISITMIIIQVGVHGIFLLFYHVGSLCGVSIKEYAVYGN
ncbi:hypothetical protein [Mixta mediterraneensis]|uniref:hypothetical protein n=1 Tax=Mixta mediterraneensis TaxID=2758443 RepID=UPI001874FAC9|nr:hypothetical protein [Mixta mediterraneensis]